MCETFEAFVNDDEFRKNNPRLYKWSATELKMLKDIALSTR
jgi:hypothetical protein